MSLANPLEELEHLVNHRRLFNQIGDSSPLHPKEVEAAKKEHEALPIDDQTSFPEGVDPEIFEHHEKQQKIEMLKGVCEKASKNIQKQWLRLNSKKSRRLFIDGILESLEFLLHDLDHADNKDGDLESAINRMYEHVLYRYIYKGYTSLYDRNDKRLRLKIKQYRIRKYFYRLVVLNVISDDELELFLTANFVGFRPKKEISPSNKIVADISNVMDLAHFVYLFQEKYEIDYLGKYDLVNMLLNSFENFSEYQRETIYKKWSVRVKSYVLSK